MLIPLKLNLATGTHLNLEKNKNHTWTVSAEDENILFAPIVIKQTPEMDVLGLDHYKAIYLNNCIKIVRFADLHRHSDCSVLDGMSKIPDIVRKTEYAGALTDHGVMYGFLEYYKAMKAANKKPILGFEAYMENLECELARCHVILLAKDQQGYKNLLYLTSEAYDHMYYNKPHVTWEMLRSHHEGLIATSACMQGVAGQYLQKGDYEKAKIALKEYKKIFGEDFYIEIQRHHFEAEEKVMAQMQRLAYELNIKMIATVDSHYTNKEDREAHEALLCVQTKKTLQEPHMTFSGDGYYIHSSEEMEELFKDMPEALDNTLEIADKCNVTVPLGQRNMAIFDVPAPFATPEEYFVYICSEGFKKRFAGTPHMTDPEYIQRYDYELSVIQKMGFVSYFLIVWDYANWAREHDIYVGPGRGSAAGSLLAYCMGITDLDPIKYDLLFERFLNPDRVSMPDIDMDFEHTRRQDVIDHTAMKYGVEQVSHIITFGTFAAKQSVKDIVRVNGLPVSFAVQITSLIPNEPNMTLDKAMKMNPELDNLYNTNADVKMVIDMAKRIEGCKRNASVHACGIVLAPSPIRNFLPVLKEVDKETGMKVVTSQVVGPEVEELSLLKMDFLGLKNMTVIHDVIRNIKKTRGIDIDYHDIPLDDRETYEMLRDGQTGGVFQLESPGMTNVVSRMLSDLDDMPDKDLPQCFERMIAAVALYRPGPMDFIDDYIDGMKDQSSIHYDCKEEETILAPTYGVMVFQEQVMQIARTLAGYSMGRADILRKAMGKKKQALMDAEHAVFIHGNLNSNDPVKVPGCVGNGIREEVAEEIWNKMVKFASYAFNRSHAACYAYIAILTAYMRCHWMPEFYAAMCNAFHENSDKLQGYLVQASKAHLKILPPDINHSDSGFTSDNGQDIRFGFSGLKGVKNFGPKIVEEREANGDFSSPFDFYSRMLNRDEKPNKTILESLTWSGAMEQFGHNKPSLMKTWDSIEKICTAEKERLDAGQFTLFAKPTVEYATLPPADEKLEMDREKEMVGFYLTKHPVDAIYPELDPSDHIITLGNMPYETVRTVKTIGIISDVRTMYTKRDGRRMFAFTISDRFTDIRCIVFPNDAESNANNIFDGNVVLLEGSLKVEDEMDRQLVVRTVMNKDQIHSKKVRVQVSVNSKEEQNELLQFVKDHPGKVRVSIIAKGKEYPLTNRVNVTAGNIDWLKQNFSNVSCG